MKLPLLFDELALDKLSDEQRRQLDAIDDVLPQTQCGLCGHKNGCLPYAHAILTQNEPINLCVPGGDETARHIAHIMQKPPLPAIPSKWGKDPTTHRPLQMSAVIDESSCIGCTKCLPACPVDAIVGTAKHMHSVIDALCTGCELCIAPCPVDCITLIPTNTPPQPSNKLKQRYHAHLNRLTHELKQNNLTLTSHTAATLSNQLATSVTVSADTAKATLELAKLRTQIKKLEKQLALRFDPIKEDKLTALKARLDSQT